MYRKWIWRQAAECTISTSGAGSSRRPERCWCLCRIAPARRPRRQTSRRAKTRRASRCRRLARRTAPPCLSSPASSTCPATTWCASFELLGAGARSAELVHSRGACELFRDARHREPILLMRTSGEQAGDNGTHGQKWQAATKKEEPGCAEEAALFPNVRSRRTGHWSASTRTRVARRGRVLVRRCLARLPGWITRRSRVSLSGRSRRLVGVAAGVRGSCRRSPYSRGV